MVNLIRSTEKVLGKTKKILSKGEKQNALAVRKSCVSSEDIYKGDKILENLFLSRGLEQAYPLFYYLNF